MYLFRILGLIGVFISSYSFIIAQDNLELFYLYTDNVKPIAQFGWGIPYDAVYTADSTQVAIATGAGVTFYNHQLVEVHHINTHGHSPDVIAISPDGKTLATGSDDVYLWDIETHQNIDILQTGHGVSDISFSADGRLIAVSKGWTSARDTTGILIFEATSGRLKQHLHFSRGGIFQQVEFNTDNQYLLAIDCCHAGILLKIDLETLQAQRLINSEGFTVSPAQNKIVSFTHGWAILDDLENQQEPYVRSSQESRYARAISPIGKDGLFSGVLENGDYGRWDSDSLKPITSGSLGFQPRIAAVSPDGRWLTAVDRDGLIVSLNIETQDRTVKTYLYAKSDTLAVVGDRVFFVTNREQLAWWNIWTGEHGIYANHQSNIDLLMASPDAWLYVVSDSRIIQRVSPFNQTGSTTLFEQPNTRIISMTVQNEGDLFVVVCEQGDGKLLRLDSTTGESLGFYPDYDANEPTLSEINLPHCELEIIATFNSLFYVWGSTVARFDGIHANSFVTTQLPLPDQKLHIDDDPFTVIHKSAAFNWAVGQQFPSMTLIASHAYEITAIARIVESGLVASAACEKYEYGSGNEFWCYGVDMALTNSDQKRSSLIGHTATVSRILLHSYLPVFVSVSEDGTILVWGAPIESQLMRREGLLESYTRDE